MKLIAEHVHDLILDDVYLRVSGLGDLNRLYLKVEGFNPGGSVKMKTARGLIHSAENSGADLAGLRLIESTSGNLGISLAVICAAKNYRLTLVTDPNSNATAVAIMRALGAEVVVITERDDNGGYLGSRISYIQQLQAEDPNVYWLNQYENPTNPTAHEQATAPSVLREFGEVDYLFLGVGTGGTLMGCIDYFRRRSPQTRIIAVDTAGSVNFQPTSGPRHIPGLGTSQRPPILDSQAPDEVLLIPEWETVRECRWLARSSGLLTGGSTGTVLAGIRRLAPGIPPDATVVAISPDLGERYLNSVYDDTWVAERGLDKAPLTDERLPEEELDVLV
ncbi:MULTISPECIES: 2,3-diaminopropionate biosynthesis protein SbnA [Streptomyces]|uniref:2,3-diaminopropionate biosynthesis protein SbnA n=1 Tax=Streptomyces TaxID=1883 RepID=UPI001922F191|nr:MULTISPECIES: 2,3-diaminopropionate biosynthesis protein SbnA [Streptomyces]MCM9082829.1 2,3-diaminopropionate biosynthesis protein SbnA [Streptomyces spororaveus]MCX5302402.1 2,3-diaminopropionate biosynthesis protein SbnA [Streptomyces sp. NBC_00160]